MFIPTVRWMLRLRRILHPTLQYISLHPNHVKKLSYNEGSQVNKFEHVQVVVTWKPPEREREN